MEGISIEKRKRWTINEIAEFTNGFNYILYAEDYKTQKDKLPMICPEGHGISMSFDNFKRGKRCRECSNNNKSVLFRKDISFIEDAYKSIGYKVLDGLEEYKNNESPLLVRCDKGHSYNTNYVTLSVGSKCPHCYGKVVLPSVVFKKFKDKNYTILESKYINSDTKMRYICNHHPHEIQLVTWDNLKQDRACRFCGRERTASARRTDYSTVSKIFKDRDYELLERIYVNNSTKMRYRCLKHPDVDQEASLSSVLYSKNACRFCIEEAGHSEARDGQTEMFEFLRTRIGRWKSDSKKKSDYKCVITGEEFNDIHHLYSFSSIVKETFNELGLAEFKRVGDYTEEELIRIVSKCLEIHYRYPLGMCLSKELHVLFHSMYGLRNNTPQQFYEFLDVVQGR